MDRKQKTGNGTWTEKKNRKNTDCQHGQHQADHAREVHEDVDGGQQHDGQQGVAAHRRIMMAHAQREEY